MPVIKTQPASQMVSAGQTATFSVAADGNAPLLYQWERNGTPIAGAASSSYTTPPTTTADNSSRFVVIISDKAGSVTSNPATLTVTTANVAPSLISQPVDQTVTAGQTATFSVTASGTAPLSYQWFKNGAAIGTATSPTYATPAETTSDNGARFTVTVSNVAGSVTSAAATLTVTAGAAAPSIITQPVDQTVTAGQTATFSVTASGTAPLSYQWYKNGTAIGTATPPTYTTPAETTSDNGARFTVTVSNAAGSVTSAAATLTVTAGAAAPLIVSQPVSQSITAGQTATFSVTASGTAPLSYQWYKNGAAVGGATSPTYTTPAETTSDNGAQFTVVVSNSVGKVTSTAAALTVNAATFLLSATPASLTFGNVNTGASSTLAVTLTNSGNSQVTISSVSISGAGFNASGLSAGQILAPGQGGTLNVTFTPAVAGSVTGSLAVVSSASNSPATIPLSGTGLQTVPHSADLSWTASTSIVAGYNVYRGVQSGGPYTKLTSTPVVLTIYTDSTVQSGQAYFYVVTAVDLNNLETVHSNEVSAVIP
jgi:invasion protein IalB